MALPGGRRIPGESIVDCLPRRVLLEQTGIELTEAVLLTYVETELENDKYMVFFMGVPMSGDVEAQVGHFASTTEYFLYATYGKTLTKASSSNPTNVRVGSG